ncbi:MAG TPA: GDSL-type esterase/lipase family protein [Verrucomicrobiae bacterium]|nr:GDSL-type esterase/lipase family protein [Verrucomicrobiae bacterium]
MNFPVCMCRQPRAVAAAILTILLGVAGCATNSSPTPRSTRFRFGESVVLAGEESAGLAFAPLVSVADVRSSYLDKQAGTIHYEAGRDYIIDLQTGRIKRTAQSRIPDFAKNLLYGREDFDHSKFPGYGNGNYFVFVDYLAKHKPAWPAQPSQAALLPKARKKLVQGEKLTLVAFGDSITAGGEASRPGLIYWQRWADELKQKYPRAEIVARNGATGGDTTANGLDRLQSKVLDQHPDLVLIAFGMNDNNIRPFGVPVETFASNLRTMVDRIRSQTQAEIILVSAFRPNPKWHFGSGNMEQYARATEQVAREKQCAFADVYHNWLAISASKKPEDLLGNNINHPNDFGHWIYFQVLDDLGL